METEESKGICAVCEKPASLRCSDCKVEFYCTKDHQRNDWKRHKSACRAWEIKEDKKLGRYLVATRDLHPEELIISELPLVFGPAPHSEDRVCVGCGSRQIPARCIGCSWPVCRIDCDGLMDVERHGLECQLLAKARILPRCSIILALRLLILRRRNPKKWKTVMKLQSHEESRGLGTEAYEETKSLAQYLAPFLSADPSAVEVLPKISGLIDVNALETNPPEGSVGIYENTCLLEHQCIANTRFKFSIDEMGRPRIFVKAVTFIKKGEHLSTTYTHVFWSTRVRRDHLLATKYFLCSCERCADPSELGSHLGTLKCPCNEGLILPKDPLDEETEWSCNSCPGTLTSTEVTQLVERLGEEVEGAMGVAKREVLTDLLSRLMVLLHPCHQHCISVGHSLIQLMPSDDPQKAEICKRIISTTSIVDPYGTRLTLYTAIALRELASCPGEQRQSLLTKAASLLESEPPRSPGEKLLRLIQSELE
ncbi:SET domain-containing protein SmydA-8-like [Leptopilina boulardi]|uniref:SET domain-containing protein SmydA-8-like n=1 Tax=Leptopilina boulardi TaxID=63433 RepID=UPI0021F61157|nr:SET domain-containing protein SmydA-8-like [Leptopilina boulardi]